MTGYAARVCRAETIFSRPALLFFVVFSLVTPLL